MFCIWLINSQVLDRKTGFSIFDFYVCRRCFTGRNVCFYFDDYLSTVTENTDMYRSESTHYTVDSRWLELEPKSISHGFPSYIYCNFTLGNSNLPLTRSNFCFLSDHFYISLPSITWTVFQEPDKSKKKEDISAVQNVEFISKQAYILCLSFFVNPVQI